jgi:DNA-binding HxlR family transcriptional regulator
MTGASIGRMTEDGWPAERGPAGRLEKVRVSRGGKVREERPASPRQALALIADKWAVLIITTLAGGPHRYNALRREIDGVSQKMLTQSLRDLECNGLVLRTVYPDTPPRVEYRLTPLGETLVDALGVLRDWAGAHYHEVEDARRAYCGAEPGECDR